MVSEFAVAWFNADGSLDNGFGTGGKVTTNFVGVQVGVFAVVVGPRNGQIPVGAAREECVALSGVPRETAGTRLHRARCFMRRACAFWQTLASKGPSVIMPK